MSDTPPVSEAYAVTRTITVDQAGHSQFQLAIETLERIEPVVFARRNGDDRLQVRYDASCISFGDIRRLLAEAGIACNTALPSRIRSAWYGFIDRNIRSNAIGGSGACCNRPPAATHRKE